MARTTHYTTDHQTIKRWAEARGGKPSTVKGTKRGGEEAGILRIDFPGYSGEGTLRKISWNDFFKKFDKENLVFIYQDKTRGGQKSNFNKVIRSPEGARVAQKGKNSRSTSSRGTGGQTTRGGKARTSGRQAEGRTTSGSRSATGRRTGTKSTARSSQSTTARRGTAASRTRTKRGEGMLTRGQSGAATRAGRQTGQSGRSASTTSRGNGRSPTSRTRGSESSTRAGRTGGTRSRSARKTQAGSPEATTGTRGQRRTQREAKPRTGRRTAASRH